VVRSSCSEAPTSWTGDDTKEEVGFLEGGEVIGSELGHSVGVTTGCFVGDELDGALVVGSFVGDLVDSGVAASVVAVVAVVVVVVVEVEAEASASVLSGVTVAACGKEVSSPSISSSSNKLFISPEDGVVT